MTSQVAALFRGVKRQAFPRRGVRDSNERWRERNQLSSSELCNARVSDLRPLFSLAIQHGIQTHQRL